MPTATIIEEPKAEQPPLDTAPVTSTADAIIAAMESEKVDWATGKKAKVEPEAAPAADPKPAPTSAKPAAATSEIDAELKALEAEVAVAKPAAADPAKPEEDLFKGDEPPKGSSPKAAESWNALKAKYSAEYSKLKRELEAVKKQPTADPDLAKALEALKTERDDLSSRLERVRLQEHPRFQNYFVAREKQAIEDLKAIASETHGDRLAALVNLPESKYKKEQLDDLLGELPESSKVQVGAAMVELRKLQREKEATLANAPSSLKQIQAQEQQEQQAARAKAEAIFDQVAKDAADKLPEWLQPIEGNDEWNSAVKRRVDSAKALLTGNHDPAMLSRAAIYSAVAKDSLDLNKKQARIIELYQKKIASLTSAEPTIQNTGSETTPAKEYTSFAEAVVGEAANNGFFRSR